MRDQLFTSESVSEAHPDKLCDQISDAVIDRLIAEDPDSRVAVETLATTGLIVLAGEITSRAAPDVVKVAREIACSVGYDNDDVGFNGNTCAVVTAIQLQSPDIDQGVSEGRGSIRSRGPEIRA